MASSSSSHKQSEERSVFEPPGKMRRVDESVKLCDVFINYRSPDVKETLALQLYKSLRELGIRASLDQDDGIPLTSIIETAIHSAEVHIVIFSKGFAESPWCLEVLRLMLETKAKIFPVYYGVEPSELRYIETGSYDKAFKEYVDKNRHTDILAVWKEALGVMSFLAGFEISNLNAASECKNIALTVDKETQRKQRRLNVAKYPVGLSKLVQDLESRHGIHEDGQGKTRIVGIYGTGGTGKTTLSKELFNRYCSKYSRASFLFDVREAFSRGALPYLQQRLLRDLFDEEYPKFRSAAEGISCLQDRLRRIKYASFLIVLDDIDNVNQLDGLLVPDILNKSGNSLIIVTTRDVGLLRTAGIPTYNLKGLDEDDARELFCFQAFGRSNPAKGYESLVKAFVKECEGLPLSLHVLGGYVRGRDQKYWSLALEKVRKTLPHDIKSRLKISFDSLNSQEQQIFMDVACFFIGNSKHMAIKIWEGSGWEAHHALEVLEQKSLVLQIKNFHLDGPKRQWDGIELGMHDHLRDLGRELADEFSCHRLWQPRDLDFLELMGFRNIINRFEGRCFHSFFDMSMPSHITYFLAESDDNFQTSASLLWLQLDLDFDALPSLPSWIPLQKLQYLEISDGHLERLWKDRGQAPVHLKELVLNECWLDAQCIDSIGMLCDLENLVITGRNEEMTVDGRPFSKSLRGLVKLRSLVLRYFTLTGELTLNRESTAFSEMEHFSRTEPTISESAAYRCMSNLRSMEMRGIKLVSKVSISGEYCPELESFHLASMENLIQVDLTLTRTLTCLELLVCEKLKKVSGSFDLPNLVTLNMVKCGELEELPTLKHLICLERLVIDGCEKLQKTTGVYELHKLRCLHLSGGDIFRRIGRLKKLPSEITSVVGKASHQAKTILDADQFCNVIGENTNRAIDVSETAVMLNSLSTLIICAVVRGSFASGTNAINIRLPSGLIQSNIGGGIWTVTIAITGEKDVADYKELLTVGDDAQIKKLWIVTINEDKGGNGLQVFKKIVSRLYK